MHGAMRPGHYRDPRGHLHEPHTKKSVPLGTREVAGYEFPDHVYDKILYVEKEGLGPIFEAANLAERYDMAICAGKGQPVEATRELFERAEAGDYQLFVLHDADPAGYSIARTISEETERMPDYGVDVIDVGLSVGDAIRLGLQTETFYRKAALPWWMPSRLDAEEASWFHPRRTSVTCTRVELNALGTGIVGYVEGKLADHGADANSSRRRTRPEPRPRKRTRPPCARSSTRPCKSYSTSTTSPKHSSGKPSTKSSRRTTRTAGSSTTTPKTAPATGGTASRTQSPSAWNRSADVCAAASTDCSVSGSTNSTRAHDRAAPAPRRRPPQRRGLTGGPGSGWRPAG